MDVLHDLVYDYTLRTVALGAGTLGIVSGALGAFAVLRRQSLVGDAMSHAALPGIALAYLLTGSKAPLVLLLGAAIAGWLGTLLVIGIVRETRVKFDSALGLVLSVFFGFGLMLLTFIQRRPDASQAGLDKFLFGQAATLVERDVVTMAVIGAIAIGALLGLWKEFKLLSFDPDFGATIGYPMRLLDVVLTTLIVIAIVVGLQTVGVVLMSAMIVAPAAAARQWTDRLGVMVLLSAGFGALAGVAGATVSGTTERLPTGPTIVVCISGIVLVSLLFAPNRGLLWNWLAQGRTRRRLRGEALLADLSVLASHHATLDHGHSTAVLRAMNPGRSGLDSTLSDLAARGLVRRTNGDRWTLTEAGRSVALEQAGNGGQLGPSSDD
ncbi:MAG: manganese/zinc/iron transport system permease protein [Thermomicrobiales bacterium]|nr:manganese/zinc/iron transport system permease protein [Thermomicrobiales bacterium]